MHSATVARAPCGVQAVEPAVDGGREARLRAADRRRTPREPEEAGGERGGVGTRAGGDRLEAVRERIGDLGPAALVVAAGGVAHPGRDREREVADRTAGAQLVADRAEQALRQLLRAVARDLRRAVADRGLAKRSSRLAW